MSVRGRNVPALLRQARGRLLGNALLVEGANAFSAALLVFIVLLLVGTEVLNWRWAVPIPLAAACVGAYRARKRLPSLYSTAQLIDRRLGLADTLSTALFFSKNGGRASADVRAWQFREAERVAQSVDVRRAVPYTMPRSVYAVAALFLVASSLFALRYAITRRLDLKPPLARILQLNLPFTARTEEANAVRPDPPPPDPTPEQAQAASPEDRRQSRDGQPQAGAQKQNASNSNDKKDGKRDSAQSGNSRQQPQEGEQDSRQDGQKDGAQRQAQNGSQSSGQQGDGQQNAEQQAGQNGSGENSSLMNKVKDAVQNLLSRMKPQQGSQGSQGKNTPGSQSAQNGSQGKGQQNGSRQQAGKEGQHSSGQGDEARQGEADRMAQDSQNGQGKAAGNSDQQASKQPGSGIGSQDGSKEIKEAEQLAAMGKISEILGKRAAQLSGEATVEVQSSNQQLRTPYAQRTAEHSEGGAEIGRDEVPPALQAYVEQYFEQVRKAKKK